jgi:hypothetical protein
MRQTAELRCRCGAIRGRVTNAARDTVNRVVCYCNDCQAFAHHLGRADLLDEHGGTDIVQVAPAEVLFEEGGDRIVGLRLSPKGLFRFYAPCCNTPLGNSVGTAIPFVGLVAQSFSDDRGKNADDYFEPPVGAILGKFAVGTPPEGSDKLNVPLLARAIGKVLGWRIAGKSWPHPHFDRATKAPSHPVTVLSRAERDAVRPLCGPR